MTPRRRKSRIYWRQGGARRAYLDVRDYRDVGGGQEALRADGESQATTDPDVAQLLAGRRLQELDALRRGRALHGVRKGDHARHHRCTPPHRESGVWALHD